MDESIDSSSASSATAAANTAAASASSRHGGGSATASGGSCNTHDTTTPPLSPAALQSQACQQTRRDNINSSSQGCGPVPTAASVANPNTSGSSSNHTSSSMSAPTIVAGTPRRFIFSAIPPPLGAPALPQQAGAGNALTLPQHTINLNVSTTTGGNFGVTVDPQISVENLKKIIAKKLKVAKDRICLLHREKELQDGILKDYNLMDGSKIILIPNVETGLLAQRPENTVMQALESLNDSQVNDFLSGKTPLNLSMRLGDHMMLIQLQLSTVNPTNSGNAASNGSSGCTSSSRQRSSSQRSSSRVLTTGTAAAGSGAATPHLHNHHHHHHHHHHAATSTGLAPTTSAATTAAARKAEVERASNGNRVPISSSIAAAAAAVAPAISSAVAAAIPNIIKSSDLSCLLNKRQYEQHYESIQSIVKSIAMARPTRPIAVGCTAAPTQVPQAVANAAPATNAAVAAAPPVPTSGSTASSFHASSAETVLLEQSPIKSLSNLVSSPIKTAAIKHIPIVGNGNSSSSSSSTTSANAAGSQLAAPVAVAPTAAAVCQDPIAAKLTSCLCTRLNGGGALNHVAAKSCIESACVSRQDAVVTSEQGVHSAVLTSTPKTSLGSSLSSGATSPLHKTANNPIARSKHRHHHHHHHHHHHYHHHAAGGAGSATAASTSIVRPNNKLPNSPRSTSATSNDSGFVSDDSTLAGSATSAGTSSAVLPAATAGSSTVDLDDSGIAVSDTRTLAEASRNLTQTLRKLSKEVFANKIDLSAADNSTRKGGSGAVIESMKNHGKGIYSGTFSGTLNPALQDRYGRPKRDISTVIHILNDLLSATPQYSRGARISFEAPSTSATANGAASAHNNRIKQLSSKHHQNSHTCVKCVKSTITHSHHHHSSSASPSGTIANGACAYGECNGHYVSKAQAYKQTCCQDLSTSGAGNASDAPAANDRNVCSCRYGYSEKGERQREHTCQKCLVVMDNLKTKSKLDQLRRVMQQSKQKREARKLKLTPYGARVVGATTAGGVVDAAAAAALAAASVSADATSEAALASSSSTASASGNPLSNSSGPTTPPSEVSPNHNHVEEVDTAA